ncbi:hypothetical protein HAV22_22520 [Massilia sp. TW-1]|uniref:Uncharacterized protein n=1 Tax=Telluria antibiotica TaxID=2717319 RepID=A0ABX0PG49_9BURK|nr:hypothetical protein [Telluria antibiotica]
MGRILWRHSAGKDVDTKHNADLAAKGNLWDDKTISSVDFFEGTAAQGYKLRLHEGDVLDIDLGDERLPW